MCLSYNFVYVIWSTFDIIIFWGGQFFSPHLVLGLVVPISDGVRRLTHLLLSPSLFVYTLSVSLFLTYICMSLLYYLFLVNSR